MSRGVCGCVSHPRLPGFLFCFSTLEWLLLLLLLLLFCVYYSSNELCFVFSLEKYPSFSLSVPFLRFVFVHFIPFRFVSFLGFVLGRRVGLDRQGVDGTALELLGKDLVDQPVALQQGHLFEGVGDDRQRNLGSTVAAPSHDADVQMGHLGEPGVIGKASGADKVFGNLGRHCVNGRMDGWMEVESNGLK